MMTGGGGQAYRHIILLRDNPSQWQHINTEDNPGDLRGINSVNREIK